jgi:hypothetical protein
MAALDGALVSDDRTMVHQFVEQCRQKAECAGASPADRELLALAAARALKVVAVSVGELLQAEHCLVGLDKGRPDLPEANILSRTIQLRIAARSEGGSRLTYDRLEQLTDELPDIPLADLFRAECWYQFVRSTPEAAIGPWNTCLEQIELCLSSPQWHEAERREPLLLRALAKLMLAREPDDPAELSPGVSESAAWLAGLRLAAQSVRKAHFKVPRAKLPNLPEHEPGILHPADVSLVRIALMHAVGKAADESLFGALAGWGRGQFFAIRLLRARQARLRGRETQANGEYTALLQEALNGGPDFLLDVAAAENAG